MLYGFLSKEDKAPFHTRVESVMQDGAYSRVSRQIGIAPDGDVLIAAFGKFGPYVQKGEGDNRQFASLQKDQLIENLTVEDALRLFELPRTVGNFNGIDIIVTKGRFGPYIKYGDRNITLPRNTDPLKVSLEDCISVIGTGENAAKAVIHEWGGIQVIRGNYGPYIKAGGKNYKIPRGTNAETMTEADAKAIIEGGASTSAARPRRTFKRK